MLYFIARISIEQQMNRQFDHEPDLRPPERPLPQHSSITVAVRLRLSASLRAIASAIEPTQREPACTPNLQR